MKKKAIFVSLIVVLAIAMCALVGCGSSIKLVDFPATMTDEEQTLGDVYELRRTVEDEAGKSYNLSAEVKTAGGGLVNVVNSAFELTDPSGYVVTYTATVGEKDTRTCVVTVPVVDEEKPTVAIGNAANAVVGEKYTLPEIKFTDYTELVTSVKLFYVTESGETEVELKAEDGKYTFTPASVGTYRIKATATDSAGNTTTRTADFTADVILRGEIFRPDSLGARDQIRSSAASPTIEFVSDADNRDTTYGGAYWRVVPNETGWKNTFVTPRMSIENYEDFEFIAFWFYAESAGASAPFNLPILADVDLQQKGVMSNTWTLIEIPTDKFVEKYEEYLFAIYYSNTAITGARVGMVRGAYHSVVEVSEPVVGTVDGTEPATVTFTASGKHGDDDIAVTAKVTDASGNEVTTFTENNGAYNYKISQVGEYTLTVAPADGVYVGSAVKTFTVKNANTIDVTGELSECVEQGVELDLPAARVLNNGLPTSETVTVSVLEKATGASEWTDRSEHVSGGKYTPSDLGELKVVYSFTELEEVELTAQIVKRGEVFDPESAGARGQLRSTAASPTIEFVSAGDNDDPTYGGAYWRVIPNATGWKNTFVTPRMNIENYAGYDAIAFWFYAESAGDPAPFNLPILEDEDLQQKGVMSKTWTLIEIPTDKFIERYEKYLFAIAYSDTAITGARIGEIFAVKSTVHSVTNVSAGKIQDSTPAAVSFDVSVTPAELNWTVAVAAPDGSAVTVNKTGNTVSFSAAAEGNYTYTITTMEGVHRKITKGTINVASMSVEENEVFNPEANYAVNNITVANAAFNGTVKTVVTEAENTDTTYGGAYYKYTTVSGQWGRVGLTPYYETAYYADYDYLTAWVYIGQTEGSAKTNMKLIYGNLAFMCGYVPTDEWVKVTIAKPYDGMTGTYADNVFFSGKVFGNDDKASSFDFVNNFFAFKTLEKVEYFAIGKIEAHKFSDGDKTETKFFDPAAENVADKIGRSVAADTIETDGVVNPDPEGGYNGAVIAWTPVGTGWKNFYLHSTECADVNEFYAAFGNCSAIKLWVYIKSTDSQTKNRNFEMLMFNATYGRQKIVTDKWVEVTINMGGYIVYYDGNKNFTSNPNFFSQNAFAGETIYIGSASAVSYM